MVKVRLVAPEIEAEPTNTPAVEKVREVVPVRLAEPTRIPAGVNVRLVDPEMKLGPPPPPPFQKRRRDILGGPYGNGVGRGNGAKWYCKCAWVERRNTVIH